MRILLAEDDQNLGYLLSEYLTMEGFRVTLCRDGEEAFSIFKHHTFDMCVFDVMMPKKDGFSLAKDIRGINTNIPILFLTAKAMKEDKIEGFELGGDDYMTKPFDEEELVLRIKAILKRTKSALIPQLPNLVQVGEYTFDTEKQELIHNEQVQRITHRESEILKMLIARKDNVLRREDALVAIWGANDYFHGRSFDVFITKLRKYFQNDKNIRIENIHSVGFMLTDKP